MKAWLMHPQQDFRLDREPPPGADALTQDLELSTVWNAMAGGDRFLFEVARQATLSILTEPEVILYRQRVLADCLEHPSVTREIYEIVVGAIEGERKVYFGLLRDSPERLLHRCLEVLELFVDALKGLRAIADERAADFRSEGFRRFFAMVRDELSDEYFQRLAAHLKELEFRRGILISAELGRGNVGTNYVLRRPHPESWMQRLGGLRRSTYTFYVPERDEGGARTLTELRERGLNVVANAVAQATDHILNFFHLLRAELAFYIGCMNLRERLAERGLTTCFPVPVDVGDGALSARGLYDVCLGLNLETRVVPNDLDADRRRLIVITGANQGGKSTFLRSVGLAQLMMQAGMFVPAETFRASVCKGLFVHYRREEDATMESGRLDEELARMSAIVDHIRPGAALLCNESFSSTNQREGSEIARQVLLALMEKGIKVLYVTHLYDLAEQLSQMKMETVLFLRAERDEGGRRTFRMVEGRPLPTSHGEDVYRRVFGRPAAGTRSASPGDRG